MYKLILSILFTASLTISCGDKSTDTASTEDTNIEDTDTTEDTNTEDTDTEDTDTEDTNTSNSAPYPECREHSDCSDAQFCGVECWTGGCGENEDVEEGVRGTYCQPCDECEAGQDSITGDCSVCD
jgi:hypothetical protein